MYGIWGHLIRSMHGAGLRVEVVLSLLTAVLATTGCARDHVIEIDPRYSLNVIRTPVWWPGEDKELTPAQQEVLFRYGIPDNIRLWWRRDGSFITSSDLSGREPKDIAYELQTMRHSWIYLDSKDEIRFSNNGMEYEVEPLSEVLEKICLYGDPSFRSQPRLVNGVMRETWQWMEFGEQIELVDGEIVSTRYFDATGQGTWVLK